MVTASFSLGEYHSGGCNKSCALDEHHLPGPRLQQWHFLRLTHKEHIVVGCSSTVSLVVFPLAFFGGGGEGVDTRVVFGGP